MPACVALEGVEYGGVGALENGVLAGVTLAGIAPGVVAFVGGCTTPYGEGGAPNSSLAT